MAQRPAARSATGRTRPPLRWIPWVALVLLALIALLIWIVVANTNDDDAAPHQPSVGPADLTTILIA